MKRTALYIRVSTMEQAQEGYSIDEQKNRLIAYCKAQDLVISNIYIDGGYTGSNLKRPGIQKLIAEITNFDLVLVYKLDRLSRSQRDTLYLIEEVFLPHKVDFISMQESFDTSSPLGKAMIGLLAVFAQLEREQIKERTQMGRVARAKAGLHQGCGYISVGYEYNRDRGCLVVNPYEAEQVRKIYELYLAGSSFADIAQYMKNAGYTNKYSSYNTWSSIRRIIDNEVYTGRILYDGIRIENAHEAIIPKEVFDAVQIVRGKRRKAHHGNHNFSAKHFLTGLLFCGFCGARYYLRTTNHGKYRYAHYCCYSRTKPKACMVKDPNCKNRKWQKDELDSIIENEVRKLLQSPDMVKDIVASQSKAPVSEDKDDATKRRIREIDKQIGKLMELYQQDGIPPDLLGEKIHKLYAEKTALESTIKPEAKTADDAMPFDLLQTVIANATKIWDYADELQKHRILQTLISRIILTGDDVKIEWRV